MSEYRFSRPFAYDNHTSNQFNSKMPKLEDDENVYAELEQEYAPSLIPRENQVRPKEFVLPQIIHPDQFSQIRKIDEVFNLEPEIEEPQEEIKAESYALPAKFITKDDTADQEIALRTQILIDKLSDYKKKCIELRDKNLEASKNNFEKQREVERLKIEKEHLENQITEMSMFNNKRGPGGIITLRQKADDEQRRRQEMRKELVMGIALMEGDLLNLTGRQDLRKNFLQKVADFFWNLFQKFVILKGDLKRIEAVYDKSISSYFSFYKFVVNLGIFVLAVYSYLMFSHLIVYSNLSSFCQGTPCFAMFYSFSSSEAFTYSITFIAMIFGTVLFSIIKWIRADKLKRRTEIYGGNDAKLKKFSAIVFNSWDWTINSEIAASDQSVNISNLITTALEDEVKQANAANRTAKQKTALLGKRIIGTSVYIFLLCTGWIIIIILSITQNDISNYFKNSGTAISTLMQFVPKIGISVVSAFFPAVAVKITTLESWDNPSFIIKIQTIRMYFAKILNIIVFAALNLELATNNTWFGSTESRIPFNSNYYCRENQAGIGLATLVISEFFTSKIIPLVMVALNWMIAKCKKSTSWKKEIRVSQQVINLIYFQGLLWITIPFYPYIAIIAPFLLYIDFKFQLWKLRKLQAKPLEQTQTFEVIILIMRLFNITLIMVLAYFGYFLTADIYHATYGTSVCGPFDSGTPSNQVVVTAIKDTSGLSQLWNYFFDYSPVFWIIMLLLITNIFFLKNDSTLLKEYLEEKQIETDHQIEELQKLNARLTKQNELNKKLD